METSALKAAVPHQLLFMQAAFEEARESNAGSFHEWFCTFAGKTVRVRVVGEKLRECIDLPWAHLRTRVTPPPLAHLTIELWDQHETGIQCDPGAVQERVRVSQSLSRSRDGRFIVTTLPNTITCLDRSAKHLVGFTTNAQHLSLYERGRPLHVPLTIWHNDRGVQVIHAGLVSRNGQGVLLAGSSGAGKSTSALTCLSAGFSYLGDDLVGLQALTEGSFMGHSIYGSTSVDPEHLKHFPLLRSHAFEKRYPHERKLLILLSQLFPQRLESAAQIQVVALPRVVDASQSRVRRASKGEALLALAPSSLLLAHISAGVRGFDNLAQLVERSPCYWLDLGRDLETIPQRVEELLSKVDRT